jgi:hypothetical protein
MVEMAKSAVRSWSEQRWMPPWRLAALTGGQSRGVQHITAAAAALVYC